MSRTSPSRARSRASETLPAFGLLNVNKPSGTTSRSVVDQVQGAFGRRTKTGHAGTLDPLASGVLVLCVGPATRLVPWLHRLSKSYRAEFRLGWRSDTDDVTGEVTEQTAVTTVDRSSIERELENFRGRIWQLPPRFSAVQVAGVRAYARARQGEEVELAPREVEVQRLEIAAWQWPDLVVDVECGSGTYIRSLGRDLGERLGTGAVMTSLVRTAIGPFRLADAVTPAELTREMPDHALLNPTLALPDHVVAVVSDVDVDHLRHGRAILLPELQQAGECVPVAAVSQQRRLIAIGEWRRGSGRFRPVLVPEGI